MKARPLTSPKILFPVLLIFILLLPVTMVAENRVILTCPTDIPSPNGDSIGIPVYFSNDVALGGFSLGFHYNSDDVEVTSVDFTGAFWIETNGFRPLQFKPELNMVLVGWADFSNTVPIPPQDSGLAFTLWFQIPSGASPQCIDIDSAFVPPAGPFIFSPATGGSITPNYYDCGPGDINIGNVSDCYPPIVDDIPNQTINEGDLFTTFDLDDYVDDGSHPDNQINWTYTGDVELIISIDPAHVVTITTPGPNWFGNETITFTATDPGGLWDSDDAIFTVTSVPDPPVAPDTSINLNEDQILNSELPGYDNDGDPLTWSITLSPLHGVITALNGSTGDFSYDPDLNYFGLDSLFYQVDDGSFPAETGIVFLNVLPINDSPVVSDITGETIIEGGTFATIALDDFVTDVDNIDSEMNWTYSGNVELLISIDGSRIATISTPHSNWFGVETITFRANDPGTAFDEDPATFTVTSVPDNPVARDTLFVTNEDTAFVATLPAHDFDLEALIYTIVDSPVNGTVTAFDVNTGQFTYLPNAEFSGEDTITFKVDDGTKVESNIGTAAILINIINDLPVVTDIPNQTITEGGSFTTFDLDNFVSDVDNPNTEISWTFSGDSELSITIDGDNVVTVLTPDDDWDSSESITFRATDLGGAFNEDIAIFTATPVNDPPVISTIPNQSIPEGSSFPDLNLSDFVTDIDNSDLQMTWLASGNIELSVVILVRELKVSSSNPDWFGSETITLIVNDPGNLADTSTVVYEKTPVNDAPVVSDIPNQTLDEFGDFATIDLNLFVSDVDNLDSEIDWTYSGDVELIVSIDGSNIATITTPTSSWFGVENITFTATDPGTLFDSDVATFNGILCGDVNGSGSVDISDAVYLINYLFQGGPAPVILSAGDVDCTGGIDISDVVYIIQWIFNGGPDPCAFCK